MGWAGVFSVAFSSDGSILASGQGDAIYLWDVATRTKIATLTGHTSSPNSVAFSSDETILASASYDNTVRLWDVSEWTGEPVTIFLEKVGESQFKAVASTGIPFDIVLPLSVTNGTIDGGANSITIPTGSVGKRISHGDAYARHDTCPSSWISAPCRSCPQIPATNSSNL